LPDKVRVAGYFAEAGLLVLETGLLVTEELPEGEAAPFSKMEILSLMPLLGAGEVMLVVYLLSLSIKLVVFLTEDTTSSTSLLYFQFCFFIGVEFYTTLR